VSFNYSVQLNDPTNAGGSTDAILTYDVQQALGVWSQYISGKGTLVAALDIANTSQGRESGGPTSLFFVGTNSQGLNLWEPSSLYELTTGNHVSGTTSDITITIDPGYFQYLDLASNLTYNSQVPSNEYNPIVVFLHELMHGFGQFGWYSQSGTLSGNYESTFDSFIQKTSSGAAYFTGPNAEAAYGGPILLTTSSTYGENYYHFGNTISDMQRSPSTVQDPLTLDLMNGIVLFYDYQYQISNLDLGVLKDLGYTLTTNVPLTTAAIQNDYLAITRTTLPLDQATTVVNAINAGTQTETQYVNGLLSQAANTTIPAVVVEASMYSATGTSAEITSLTTNFLPAQLANATQHGFNAQIYACEALGLVFAFGNENSSTAFSNNFGPSNSAMPNSTAGDAAYATAASNTIFGSASTTNLVSVLENFISNWKAFYTAHGVPGYATPTAAQIDLAARGASWGDMVGVALANNLGPLNGQAINFLEIAAQGTAVYGASLASQPSHAPFQGGAAAGLSAGDIANSVNVTGIASGVETVHLV
jgi:hypothetical protein